MLTILSSMATKDILADMAAEYEQRTGQRVALTSQGGVRAVETLRGGAAYDAAVLSADALQALAGDGYVVAGSEVALVRSAVAAAVGADAPAIDISGEAALKAAIGGVRTVGISTGPSGKYLAQRFAQWGLGDDLEGRLVVAPPGVSVGSLLAEGKVELGFQQLSELIHVAGIKVLGPLPESIQTITIFSGGTVATSRRAQDVRRFFDFFTSADMHGLLRRHGLEPCL